MKFSVLIPTYRRPIDLSRCLAALAALDRAPDQVIVVRRANDEEAAAVVQLWLGSLPLEEALIELPGQVHSLNLGLERVTGDVVCILDDDTAPHRHWLQRIEEIFSTEANVGGVGGRDYVYEAGKLQTGEVKEVGNLRWYGKFVGNHALGAPPKRDVRHLKGANMAFRMTAVGDSRFDTRLRGKGAQVRNDLAFSLSILNKGWRMVYDPTVAVDHYMSERVESDHRHAPSLEGAENLAFNHYLVISCYVQPPIKRLIALTYAHLVGVRLCPGLLRAVYYRVRYNREGLAVRAAAVRSWRAVKKISC